MGYYNLHPVQQLNFQINRLLTYGDEAGDINEIKMIVPRIKDIDSWYVEWNVLAQKAEKEKRYLHAAFYFRMAEFFLTDDKAGKIQTYKRCVDNFYKAFAQESSVHFEKYEVPYENSSIPVMLFLSQNQKGTILVHGGYDSFIEEFYLTIKDLQKSGYTILLFEGPGQGRALKDGLKFIHDWEKPVSKVLDYFDLQEAALIGISWGGYLALRAAAFEPRIKQVVAYDVMYDGFDVMTNMMPSLVKVIFTFLFKLKMKRSINKFAGILRKKKLIANWAISHGMYITGTKTPFQFYEELSKHTLRGVASKVKQDVLLLAGEKDHYIPLRQFFKAKKELVNAKSITGRVFTEQEGGEQHCQVGNHNLAVHEIINWLGTIN